MALSSAAAPASRSVSRPLRSPCDTTGTPAWQCAENAGTTAWYAPCVDVPAERHHMMQHDPTVRGRLEERDVLEVFSPAAPITRRDFFSGRTDQLEHLLDVVAQRGQHT